MEGETEPENGVASDTDHPALTGPSRAMPEDIAPAQFLGFDYEIRKKVRTGFSLVGKEKSRERIITLPHQRKDWQKCQPGILKQSLLARQEAIQPQNEQFLPNYLAVVVKEKGSVRKGLPLCSVEPERRFMRSGAWYTARYIPPIGLPTGCIDSRQAHCLRIEHTLNSPESGDHHDPQIPLDVRILICIY